MAHPTRGAAIASTLTVEILSGVLAPGAPLEEAALASRLGASRTPVREALRHLAASGLVELRPRRPARVMPIDQGRLSDMAAILAELEALCATRAARMMPASVRRDVEALHQRMAGLVRNADLQGYVEANTTFHARIYDAADSGYLRHLIETTHAQIALHRGSPLDSAERLARSHAEHGAIVLAILRGDAAGAADAMRAHLAGACATSL